MFNRIFFLILKIKKLLGKFNKKQVFLISFLVILVLFSLGVFGYVYLELAIEPVFFEDSCVDVFSGAVILTASTGAMGFGHTAILLEENESWFYFSWRPHKVVFVEVPNYALNDFVSFNSWIREDNSVQHYWTNFDSAIFVDGDFSESVVKARSLYDAYLVNNNLSHFSVYNNFLDFYSFYNNDYNLILNNCVDLSYYLLSFGFVSCDGYFGDLVKEPSFVSNLARRKFELQLGDDSFFI